MRTEMQQLGKFQLRRVLGKGASGTVYLALDTFSGKDVALKVLDQDRFRLELKDEASPGVLKEGESFTYVVMPISLT